MNTSTSPNDLRKFGLLMGAILAGVFGLILPLLAQRGLPTWPWALALAFWAPAVVWPKSLTFIYKAWMKIGDVLGFINSRIILGILFFIIITPIGLLRRLFGKDVMGKTFDLKAKTYRTVVKPRDPKHMERPF